jgi:branched-subunit amino acid transport protein AzlD
VDVERTIYLAGAVAVGWAVTYALRALPFLLFSRSSRELPKWVEKLGGVISPVIIAALVIYSYSGLEWRMLRPYLAGAITVAVHLWLRNPLVSIVSGTAAYMACRWIC